MVFFAVLTAVFSIANFIMILSLRAELEHIKEAFLKLTDILNMMANKMGTIGEYNGIVKFVNTLMARIECKCDAPEDINS